MEMGLLIGLAVFVAAGIGNGTIAFPQKFIRKFAWENTWGAFFFLTMVVIPGLVIPFVVKDLSGVWNVSGFKTVLTTVAFGMLWGVGCISFGAVIHIVGLSLGFTLIMGTNLGIGSLLPLLLLHFETVQTKAGAVILSGIFVSIIGVTLVGYAGYLKGKALDSSKQHHVQGQDSCKEISKIILGIILAVFSGITSACLNLGYAFSAKINETAVSLGNPGWVAGLASWQLLFWGGFIVAGGFCIILMIKNGTWKRFKDKNMKFDMSMSFAMAVLHFITIFLYGLGAYFIGALGTSLGFAAFMSISISIANILGFLTGEWKNVGKVPIRWLVVAVLVLIFSVCLLGYGNSLT